MSLTYVYSSIHCLEIQGWSKWKRKKNYLWQILKHFSGTFRQAQAQKLMGVVSVGVLATTYLHSLVLLHCLNAEKVLMNILWEFRKPIKHYRPNGDFDTYANHNKQKKTFITKSFNAALLIKCTYLLTYVSM